MIQLFSCKRFWAYLRVFYIESKYNLMLKFALLSFAVGFVMSISGNSLNFVTLTAMLFIFAIVTANSYSINFVQRVNKIKFLLIPVSHFEKFLAMVLHLFVVIPIFYLLVLLVAQYLAVFITAIITLSMPQFTLPYANIALTSDVLPVFAMSYASAVSFYLLGSTIWRSNHFLKTTLVMFVVGFAFIIFLSLGLAATSLRGFMAATPDGLWSLADTGSWIWRATFVLTLFFTILFLYATYVRIKEMEVNETKH